MDPSETTVDSSGTASERSVQGPSTARTVFSSECQPSLSRTFASNENDCQSNSLSVPGVGSHRAALNSPTTNATASTSNEECTRFIEDDCALRPDPGTEADFVVENNPFQFTPGQLNKMFNPKSLRAFYALGGLKGLEKGLRTDCEAGLSDDEAYVVEDSAMAYGANEGPHAKSDYEGGRTYSLPGLSGKIVSKKRSPNLRVERSGYIDRRSTFSDNKLPSMRKSRSARLCHALRIASEDKVLVLLASISLFALALGFSTLQGLEWIEGLAILLAIIVVMGVQATIDWTQERQFAQLSRKPEGRVIKVIRSGRTREISVYDVLVGDVMHLEPGDLIPVDGILIRGHGVKCDESSATGESEPIKKTGADCISYGSAKGFDPFIVSGSRVLDGLGTFLVAATGIHSTYGKTMMSIRQEDITQQHWYNYTLAPLHGFGMLRRLVSAITERISEVRSSSEWSGPKKTLSVPRYLRNLSEMSRNGTPVLPVKTGATERRKLKGLQRRRAPTQPPSLPAWSSGTRAVSLFRPKKSMIDILAFNLFVATTNAEASGDSSHTAWRQRALSKLTEALVSCAFLVAPAVILLLSGGFSVFLSKHKKEGTAASAMLVAALIIVNIGPPSNTEPRNDERFIQLAVEMSYAMFMLVYCKLVLSRNKGGKGFCFIAVVLGVLLTAIAMISASVRDYLSALTRNAPLLAIFIAIPLSFTLCDLAVYLAQALNNHGVEREPVLLPSPTPGPGQTPRRLQYFSLKRLRRRNQSLLHSDVYDEDAEDFDLATADGALEPERFEPNATRSAPARCLRWIAGMFGKRKPL